MGLPCGWHKNDWVSGPADKVGVNFDTVGIWGHQLACEGYIYRYYNELWSKHIINNQLFFDIISGFFPTKHQTILPSGVISCPFTGLAIRRCMARRVHTVGGVPGLSWVVVFSDGCFLEVALVHLKIQSKHTAALHARMLIQGSSWCAGLGETPEQTNEQISKWSKPIHYLTAFWPAWFLHWFLCNFYLLAVQCKH